MLTLFLMASWNYGNKSSRDYGGSDNYGYNTYSSKQYLPSSTAAIIADGAAQLVEDSMNAPDTLNLSDELLAYFNRKIEIPESVSSDDQTKIQNTVSRAINRILTEANKLQQDRNQQKSASDIQQQSTRLQSQENQIISRLRALERQSKSATVEQQISDWNKKLSSIQEQLHTLSFNQFDLPSTPVNTGNLQKVQKHEQAALKEITNIIEKHNKSQKKQQLEQQEQEALKEAQKQREDQADREQKQQIKTQVSKVLKQSSSKTPESKETNSSPDPFSSVLEGIFG